MLLVYRCILRDHTRHDSGHEFGQYVADKELTDDRVSERIADVHWREVLPPALPENCETRFALLRTAKRAAERPWCVASLAGTAVGLRFLFYGRRASGKLLGGSSKSLRWGHPDALS